MLWKLGAPYALSGGVRDIFTGCLKVKIFQADLVWEGLRLKPPGKPAMVRKGEQLPVLRVQPE